MKIAIVFATTEGQTGKIAGFVQDWLFEHGHQTALVSADAANSLDLSGYDAIVLAASVHTGRYQPDFVEYVTESLDALLIKPTLFLSVSLAAAGDAEEDWIELSRIVTRLEQETGWTPGRVEQIAGAFRFSHYGFVKYWALRWIEAHKDPEAILGEDKEYTDWLGLEGVLRDWTDGLDAVR